MAEPRPRARKHLRHAPEKSTGFRRKVIAELAYISKAANAELPKEVIETAKRHILDTLAAMVSGSPLKPGKLALKYIEGQGGKAEAHVAASKLITSPSMQLLRTA